MRNSIPAKKYYFIWGWRLRIFSQIFPIRDKGNIFCGLFSYLSLWRKKSALHGYERWQNRSMEYGSDNPKPSWGWARIKFKQSRFTGQMTSKSTARIGKQSLLATPWQDRLLPDPRRTCAAEPMCQHCHTITYSLLLEPGLPLMHPWACNPALVWAESVLAPFLCVCVQVNASGWGMMLMEPRLMSVSLWGPSCLILFLLQIIQTYTLTNILSSYFRSTVELWPPTFLDMLTSMCPGKAEGSEGHHVLGTTPLHRQRFIGAEVDSGLHSIGDPNSSINTIFQCKLAETFLGDFPEKIQTTQKSLQNIGCHSFSGTSSVLLYKNEIDHNQEKQFLSAVLVAKKLLLQMQMSLVIPKKIDWTSAKCSRGAGRILLNAIQQKKILSTKQNFLTSKCRTYHFVQISGLACSSWQRDPRKVSGSAAHSATALKLMEWGGGEVLAWESSTSSSQVAKFGWLGWDTSGCFPADTSLGGLLVYWEGARTSKPPLLRQKDPEPRLVGMDKRHHNAFYQGMQESGFLLLWMTFASLSI